MKISDFKFAEFFIRGICKTNGCPFVDLALVFAPESIQTPSLDGGKLLIGPSDKLSKTIFQIVAGYLQNIEQISGSPCNLTNEERILIINTTLSLVRDLTYSSRSFSEGIPQKTVALTLNRDPFVWTVMRSIICPSFDKPLKNVRILARRSPLVDGAKYFRKDDVPTQGHPHKNDALYPFVFSNLEIENTPCRTAYLLYETIRAHEMDPRGVIHEIFTKQELWSKFFGIARAAFRSTEAINDFMTTLSIISDEMASVDKRLVNEKKAKWSGKTGLWSQSQYNENPSTWWYLGLIEKMLEPARGTDWSGYFTMKPFTDELYEKVEMEKKRRGMKELPMELLLRLQGNEFKSQPDLIIEGLLADNRVW